MTRRALLALLVCSPASARERVPTDDGALNDFAKYYNRYVETLRSGVIDTKAWARVVTAWGALTGR